MLFSSITFLFYFLPIVIIFYYLFKFSKIIKNLVLLCFSLLFYAWGNVGYIFVLILSILFNYIFGLLVDRYRDSKFAGKLTLWITCIFNISILFSFKYLVFAVEILNDTFNISFNIESLYFGAPMGISFFTFKAISYVIDVYTRRADVENNPLYVGLYISFFPQILAGPVVQYSSMAYQLKNRTETVRMFSVGCCRFITGLAKKVIIANNLALVVDNIYLMNDVSGIPMTLAWIGAIAYSLQIYYDFSGYSDMAIGICLMFGFKIDENFKYPYMSKSITEFWRRWHISLGKWFRDYVYIPLGGSRVENKDKVIRNIFVVWILTGIWHGSDWTFLLWGLLNFAFIAIEKVLSIHEIDSHNILRRIYTLFTINILWVIFRAEGLQEAGSYIVSMFGVNGFYSPYSIMFLREYIVFFVLGIVFSVSVSKKVNNFIVSKAPFTAILNVVYPLYMFIAFMICVVYLVRGSYNPFVYINF